MNCYIFSWFNTLLYYGPLNNSAKKLIEGLADACKRQSINWPNDKYVLVTDVNDEGDFIFEVAEIEG